MLPSCSTGITAKIPQSNGIDNCKYEDISCDFHQVIHANMNYTEIDQMKQYLLSILFILLALTSAQSVSGSQDVGTMPTVAPLRSLDNNASSPASGSGGKGASVSTPDNQSNATGVPAAPGANAMMTRDLLLVSPSKGEQPKPLQNFVGTSLTLTIGRSDIILDGLTGISITVSNDTSRPLLIDGHNAKAISGSNTYLAASVRVVQQCVLPNNSAFAKICRLLTDLSLGGLTVGAVPTVKDYITMKKPINKRYGSDERRRIVEASRFGKRILWPHDKTGGILYFKTKDKFTDVKLQIPVNTLFDKPDNAVLTNP